MVRFFLCSAMIAISAPAIAQDAAPASPQAAEPATATPQAAQPAPANPADAVASIVDGEFPSYDANGDGQLDQAEFGRWMTALKEQEMKATGKMLPPAEVTAWASGAFTTADADKSASVSKVELVTYLSGATG
ncbi:Ca2+-binding EF-hand superfamily protein [Sphingobium fontiphilum]|uniref:Ca2+-binding EF-hand superfamily protein n=1 Tax=Sphingobium fontiphilum TaxID=944425 RepID=A0A7W6GMV1_9SPHN|nr:EF-hand domain-containing protein [Sphingobium fontiphilum]MBB3980673.1 Ca2+-binding EF-hand superfamily protein [Sphingobium fontiphilum]